MIPFRSDSCWALVTGTGARWLRQTGVARATRQLSGGILVALGIAAALVRPVRAAAGSA
jgi:threonine/homoserine/homoserine lactone efflux protein